MSVEALAPPTLLLPPDFHSRPLKQAIAIDPVNPIEIDDAVNVFRINKSGKSDKPEDNDFRVEVHTASGGLLYGQTEIVDQARQKGWTYYDENDPTKTVTMLPDSVNNQLSLERGGELGVPSVEISFEFNLCSRALGNVAITASRVKVKPYTYPQFDQILRRSSSQDNPILLKSVARRLNCESGETSPVYSDRQSEDIVGYIAIKTNQIVAEQMEEADIPWLFRNHGSSELIGIYDEKQRELLQMLNLAEYSRHPTRHRGLRIARYCHFTSPLRRFPDLANHLNLHAHMNNLPIPYDEAEIDSIAAEITAKCIESHIAQYKRVA